MPRPETKRIRGATRRNDFIRAPSRPQVTAGFQDAGVGPDVNSKSAKLAEALAKVNPLIQTYANKKLGERAYKEETRMLNLGRQGHIRGIDPEGKPEGWVKGYMEMDGFAKAQTDAQEFVSWYENEFDKDNADFEEESTKWWHSRAGGINDDPSFAAGYTSTVAKVIEKMGVEHEAYRQGQIVDKLNANAMKYADSVIQEYIADGTELTGADLDAIKAEVMTRAPHLSNKEWNEMIFSLFNSMGSTGKWTQWRALKEPHADGTPGMYDIPQWRDKIDAAEASAIAVHNGTIQQKKLAAAAEQERMVNEAVAPFYQIAAAGNYAEAQTMFMRGYTSGMYDKFMTPTDFSRHLSALGNVKGAEGETYEQEATANVILTDIYSGKNVTELDISNEARAGTITWDKARQLISEYQKVKAEREKQGSAGAEAARQLHNHPLVGKGLDYVNAQINAGIDMAGPGRVQAERLRGAAALEYTKRIAEAGTHENALRIAEEVAAQFIGEADKIKENMPEAKGIPSVPGRDTVSTPTLERVQREREVIMETNPEALMPADPIEAAPWFEESRVLTDTLTRLQKQLEEENLSLEETRRIGRELEDVYQRLDELNERRSYGR